MPPRLTYDFNGFMTLLYTYSDVTSFEFESFKALSSIDSIGAIDSFMKPESIQYSFRSFAFISSSYFSCFFIDKLISSRRRFLCNLIFALELGPSMAM